MLKQKETQKRLLSILKNCSRKTQITGRQNFYTIYYAAHNIKIAQIGSAANRVSNIIDTVYSLIKENLHTPDEQKAAGREVAYAVANFSSYLIPNATNNLGTTTESIDKAVDEWLVPICLMNIHVGDSLVKYFGDYEIAEKAYAVVANFYRYGNH